MTKLTIEEIQYEIARIKKNKFIIKTLIIIFIMIAVTICAAFALTSNWFSVLEVYSDSMAPTLENNEMLIIRKNSSYESGDVVAFLIDNKTIIRRVIAVSGDSVDLDNSGNVYLNNIKMTEDYVEEKDIGKGDRKLPLTVSDSSLFVLGDKRASSIDSRYSQLGDISEDKALGKAIFRIWPLDRLGKIT